MTISFNAMPADIRTPGQFVEFDNSKAISGLPPAPAKILVIGQRTTAGLKAALTPVRVTAAAQGVSYFGRGSQLAAMLAALFAVNSTTETWAIALDDLGGGTAATGTITIAGTATAAGTLPLMVAGVKVPVGVASGDVAATVATAVAAAINANLDLPVTAAAVGAVVTATSRHKGTMGNDVEMRTNYYQGERIPAGITATIVPMSAGAGNPDYATVFAAIGGERYPTLVLGTADATIIGAVDTELASRWGPIRQNDGMAFAGIRGSYGTLSAFGAARNTPFVSMIGANLSPSPPWHWAAAVAGQVAFQAALDPTRPFQTLELRGLLPPAEAHRFTRAERDLLLHDGISTFTVDAGGVVRIERLITMYQTDAYGLDDVSYLDVTTPLTLSYLRFSMRTRIAAKYPRHKLLNDDTPYGAGQAIVTPSIIRAELIALAYEWADAGLVEDLAGFTSRLIVERDATNRSQVNVLTAPDIANGFLVFAARIEFRL